VAADVLEYKPPAAAAAVAAAAPSSSAAAAAAAAAAAPAFSAAAVGALGGARSGFVDIPHSQQRRAAAARLSASKKEVPHYYLTSEVRLDAVLALRESLNADLAADAKLSLNDFLVKAAALACRKVPEVNSSWLGDAVRAYDYVDIAVSVAVPEGLATPVLRDAHAKGLQAIGGGLRALVDKARAKSLAPEEAQGGTFAMQNLGMFGVRQFAAIISPPHAAVLAVGAPERRLVPGAAAGLPGATAPHEQAVFLTATLSCDHRVVDGAVGAQWLAAFKDLIEHPSKMLL
jgi:pyruvate dehydrogenase E2 component (dihydrolipoamide acetyltransferase)